MVKRILGLVRNPGVVLIVALLISVRILTGSNLLLIYAVSYAFHFLNFAVLLVRRYPLEAFVKQALAARSLAMLTLAVLIWPYLNTPLNLYGLAPLVAGFVLHTAAVRALGLRRTYYAVELGQLPPLAVHQFPYNMFAHPMALGAMLEFLGLYILVPAFTVAYPYLIPGHLVLTAATALLEAFQWHFQEFFFPAVTGRFTADPQVEAVDSLRTWAMDRYTEHLHRDCSLHQYVKTLPPEIVGQIDKLRYSDQVMGAIRAAFPHSRVVPLWMTDELYLSRYNYDAGGDQGLFDKHYDGNLRYVPGTSVVRSLIYLSSNDHLEVVFDTSHTKANMKTYDFGILDFHKEYHWVDGSYDPRNPPRILLKCNYYIDHSGVAAYRQAGILMNLAVFYSVRAAMEYSKSPKTILQKGLGLACNFFRRVNNVNPAAPVAVALILAALSFKTVLVALAAH